MKMTIRRRLGGIDVETAGGLVDLALDPTRCRDSESDPELDAIERLFDGMCDHVKSCDCCADNEVYVDCEPCCREGFELFREWVKAWEAGVPVEDIIA